MLLIKKYSLLIMLSIFFIFILIASLYSQSQKKNEQSKQVEELQPEILSINEEDIIRRENFINSYMHFGLECGYGDAEGDIDKKERRANKQFKNKIPSYQIHLSDQSSDIYHYVLHWGCNAAFMLPSIKIQQNQKFGLIGIKFGISGNYIFSYLKQELKDNALDEYNQGTLLKYRTANIGPEMNLIFSPRSNNLNMVIRFNLLGGRIYKGEITAVPGLRDAGLSIDKSDYSASFTGYSATAGVGIYFVLNRVFPLITGFNFQYTYSKIYFNKNLLVYSGAKSTSFNDFGLICSIGIHFLGIE